MDEFLEYLQNHFNQSDLSYDEFNISSTFHLRFELGDALENGSTKRVVQSTYRAKTLFDEFFKADDDAWLIIKSWQYRGDIKEQYSSTDGYLKKQIMNYSTLNVLNREKTIEEFDEALTDDGTMEMTDFTTAHRQEVVCQKVNNITFENIFRGIANLEMGIAPSIGETVYIINRRINVAFHMYDDRGCLIFADSREILKPIFEKYNDWLVDYYRNTFNKLFS